MEKLIEVIKSVPSRSYKIIRERIVNILEKFHYENPTTRHKEFKRNICSKHWWCSFINRHPKIKELWNDIPKRTTKVLKRSILYHQGFDEHNLGYFNAKDFKLEEENEINESVETSLTFSPFQECQVYITMSDMEIEWES